MGRTDFDKPDFHGVILIHNRFLSLDNFYDIVKKHGITSQATAVHMERGPKFYRPDKCIFGGFERTER